MWPVGSPGDVARSRPHAGTRPVAWFPVRFERNQRVPARFRFVQRASKTLNPPPRAPRTFSHSWLIASTPPGQRLTISAGVDAKGTSSTPIGHFILIVNPNRQHRGQSSTTIDALQLGQERAEGATESFRFGRRSAGDGRRATGSAAFATAHRDEADIGVGPAGVLVKVVRNSVPPTLSLETHVGPR